MKSNKHKIKSKIIIIILLTLLFFHSGIYSTNLIKASITKDKHDNLFSQLIYSARIGSGEKPNPKDEYSILDDVNSIAIDENGNVYVCGRTSSNNFPTTDNAFDFTHNGKIDAFVMKLNPSLTEILYSTYIGGSEVDEALSIAIDSDGYAYITGGTLSNDFPVTTDIEETKSVICARAFLCKLSPDGSNLIYSTCYKMKFDNSYGKDITVGQNNCAYIAGQTWTDPDIDLIFVMEVNPLDKYNILFLTYYGGSGGESSPSIAVDKDGEIYVTGYTWSHDLPVTPDAFQKKKVSPEYAHVGFIFKLDSTGSNLLYSTYIGGSGRDEVNSIAVDENKCVYITGSTFSTDFPITQNSFQKEKNIVRDGFVVKIDTKIGGEAELVFSTYIGGSDFDRVKSISVDEDNNIFIAGETSSKDFPITLSTFDFSLYKELSTDCFISILDKTGSKLLYSVGIGGSKNEWVNDITLDSSNCINIAGFTNSENFPLKKDSQLVKGDIIIIKLKPYFVPSFY